MTVHAPDMPEEKSKTSLPQLTVEKQAEITVMLTRALQKAGLPGEYAMLYDRGEGTIGLMTTYPPDEVKGLLAKALEVGRFDRPSQHVVVMEVVDAD